MYERGDLLGKWFCVRCRLLLIYICIHVLLKACSLSTQLFFDVTDFCHVLWQGTAVLGRLLTKLTVH